MRRGERPNPPKDAFVRRFNKTNAGTRPLAEAVKELDHQRKQNPKKNYAVLAWERSNGKSSGRVFWLIDVDDFHEWLPTVPVNVRRFHEVFTDLQPGFHPMIDLDGIKSSKAEELYASFKALLSKKLLNICPSGTEIVFAEWGARREEKFSRRLRVEMVHDSGALWFPSCLRFHAWFKREFEGTPYVDNPVLTADVAMYETLNKSLRMPFMRYVDEPETSLEPIGEPSHYFQPQLVLSRWPRAPHYVNIGAVIDESSIYSHPSASMGEIPMWLRESVRLVEKAVRTTFANMVVPPGKRLGDWREKTGERRIEKVTYDPLENRVFMWVKWYNVRCEWRKRRMELQAERDGRPPPNARDYHRGTPWLVVYNPERHSITRMCWSPQCRAIAKREAEAAGREPPSKRAGRRSALATAADGEARAAFERYTSNLRLDPDLFKRVGYTVKRN